MGTTVQSLTSVGVADFITPVGVTGVPFLLPSTIFLRALLILVLIGFSLIGAHDF